MVKKIILTTILLILSNKEYFAQTIFEKKLLDSLIKSNSNQSLIILKQWRNSNRFLKEDSFKVNTYHNYSAYYLMNRNGYQANIYSDSAIHIALNKKLTYNLPFAYFNKATAYIYINKHDSAIILHKYVIQLCDKTINNELRAKSINSISFNLRYMGRYKESTQWLLSKINSIKDDESKGVADLHLAMNMVETSVFQNIDFYFQDAISHLKKSSNKKMLSTAYYEFANYLRTEKRFKEALTFADSITMFYNTEYSKSNFYAVKSNINYELKNYNQALTYLDSSFILDTKNRDEYYILCDYKEKGKILYAMGKYKESKVALYKAINLFQNQTDMIMEHEVYKYYLKSSTKLIDDDLHNDLNHYIGIKDSIFQLDINSNVLEYTTKYKTAEKEAQILSLQNLNLKNELALNKESKIKWGLGVFLIMSILGLYIFWKQNKRINIQKEYIENIQRELHHRIKNNLNIIVKFIEDIKKKENKDTIDIDLSDLQNKIESINTVHKQLYNSQGIHNTNLKEYIDSLAENILKSYNKEIEIKNQVDSMISIDMERIFPLGLIINEFITNSFKHGFKDIPNPMIIISSIVENNKLSQLELIDNGVGFIQIENKKSLGLRMMSLLSREINTELKIFSNYGTHLTLNFI